MMLFLHLSDQAERKAVLQSEDRREADSGVAFLHRADKRLFQDAEHGQADPGYIYGEHQMQICRSRV